MNKDVILGRQVLKDENYVNVEQYEPKDITTARFESHRKYIDIQMLLAGKERVYINNLKNVKESLGYNSEKDIEFYNDNITKSDFVTLDGSNFVLIYPWEAHAPQISVDKISSTVKKVVFKLLV